MAGSRRYAHGPSQGPTKKADIEQAQSEEQAIAAEQAALIESQGYNRLGDGTNQYGIQKGGFTMLRDKQGNLNKNLIETMDPALAKLQAQYDVEGDTQWAGLQREQLANQLSEGGDQARLRSNTGLAQGRNALAMRGGLRSGAGERMAMSNQRGLMSNLQGLGAEGRAGNLRVSMADQEMKNKVLGQLGETGQGIQGRNIGRLQGDIRDQNMFEAKRYEDNMAAYGSKQTADAQRRAGGGGGGGGCFITTACCELLKLEDDNPILNTFRNFRDLHLGGKEGVKDYYVNAPRILVEMRKRDETDRLYKVLSDYLIPCFKLIKEKKHDEAYKLYGDMFTELKNEYLGDK